MLTSAAVGANPDSTGSDSATDTKLVVTLSAKDNAKLTKLLDEVFKDLFIGTNIRQLIIKYYKLLIIMKKNTYSKL